MSIPTPNLSAFETNPKRGPRERKDISYESPLKKGKARPLRPESPFVCGENQGRPLSARMWSLLQGVRADLAASAATDEASASPLSFEASPAEGEAAPSPISFRAGPKGGAKALPSPLAARPIDREVNDLSGHFLSTPFTLVPTPPHQPAWISEQTVKTIYGIQGPCTCHEKRSLITVLIEIEKNLKNPGFADFAKEARPYLKNLIEHVKNPLPDLGCFLFYQERDSGFVDLSRSPLSQRIQEIRDNLVSLDEAHKSAFGYDAPLEIPAARTLYFLRAIVRLFVTPSGKINAGGGAAVEEIIKYTPHKLSPAWTITANAFCRHFQENDQIRFKLCQLLDQKEVSKLDQVVRFEWQLSSETPVLPTLRAWVALKAILHPFTQKSYGNCYAYSALAVLQIQAPWKLLDILIQSYETGTIKFGVHSLPVKFVIQDRLAPTCARLGSLFLTGMPEKESTPLQLVLKALPKVVEKEDDARDVIQKIVTNQDGIYRLASLTHPPMAELLLTTAEQIEKHTCYNETTSSFIKFTSSIKYYLRLFISKTPDTIKRQFLNEIEKKLQRLFIYYYRGNVQIDSAKDPHALYFDLFKKTRIFHFPNADLNLNKYYKFNEMELILDSKTSKAILSKQELAKIVWEEMSSIQEDSSAIHLEAEDLTTLENALFSKDWGAFLAKRCDFEQCLLTIDQLEGSDALFFPHLGGLSEKVFSYFGFDQQQELELIEDRKYGILSSLRELHTSHHKKIYSMFGNGHQYTCVPSLSGHLLELSQEDFEKEIEETTFAPFRRRLKQDIHPSLHHKWCLPREIRTWEEGYNYAKAYKKELYPRIDEFFFKLPAFTKKELGDAFEHIEQPLTPEALEALHRHLMTVGTHHPYLLSHHIQTFLQTEWAVTIETFKLHKAMCKLHDMPAGIIFASSNYLEYSLAEQGWTELYLYLPDTTGERLIPFRYSRTKMKYERPHSMKGCKLVILG
jgi:hypothetical protein